MKKLSIFVHCASDILTDHESHGEGLICFSILNGLAKRGHKIWAFTPFSAINSKSENLQVIESSGKMPFSSLSPWKYSLEANSFYKKLLKTQQIDFVWRMNPIGYGCPLPPSTLGKPLLTGPIYYDWITEQVSPKSRYGISLHKLLLPLGLKGWEKTLIKTDAIICATESHSKMLKEKYKKYYSFSLPLIVPSQEKFHKKDFSKTIKIIFLANLLPNKRPLFFCSIIKNLTSKGLNVEAIMIGDGPERESIEGYIKENQLENKITLLGKIDNSKIFDYLKESHIFLNAAIGEPYGRSIIESMSCACVVVSHNSGGPKDFLKNHKTGILVEGEETTDFSHQIEDLILNRIQFNLLSQSAYEQSLLWSEDKILINLEHNITHILKNQ